MDAADDVDADSSIARNRSRRTKVDRNGRLAVLAKFKEAKTSGVKIKPDLREDINVYEEVNEAEYSKIVRDRLEDDWIIDDGSGYVEDGREFFDEDEDGIASSSNGQKSKKKGKSLKNPNIRAPDSKPSNIRSMFAAAAVKPKKAIEQTVSLNEDHLLGNIMAELKQTTTSTITPTSVRMKKKPAMRNPFGVTVTGESFAAQPEAFPRASAGPSARPRAKVSIEQKMVSQPAGFESSDDMALDYASPSQDIREFISQEDHGIKAEHASQKIEDFNEPVSAADEMDVSGIDFDNDDFEVEDSKKMNGVSASTNGTFNGSLNGIHSNTKTTELSDWELDASSLETFHCTPENVSDVSIDASQLPMTRDSDGEEYLSMYWIDAFEDYFKHPGIIYLFGKVWIESAKVFVSCCVTAKNIERRIYLLPRKMKIDLASKEESNVAVNFVDVYKEFDESIAEKHKIMKYKSQRVTKNYAFEKEDVPAECEYLEVRYSADFPALPNDLQGETFSHVFGTNTSLLELFLLDRKIKGPCWLEIKNPQTSRPGVTWCKLEVYVLKPEDIKLAPDPGPPPPLVVLTMTLHALTNSKTHQNEIFAVSCLVNTEFHIDRAAQKVPYQQHFCAFSKPSGAILPFDFNKKIDQLNQTMKIENVVSERGLLGYLLAKLQKFDPDIIVGHDIVEYGLDVLLHRFNSSKVPHWSRIGRLKRTTIPKFMGSSRFRGTSLACGRLVCDVMVSAKELIRCRSYDLTELVSHVLKQTRQKFDEDEMRKIFLDMNSDKIIHLLSCGLKDATYILRMMCDLNVIPLALQITNICGNVMSRTLMGGRSERNEFLLLHAFTEKNFIVPDKVYGKKQQLVVGENEDGLVESGRKSGRKKPAYVGGLVLEPKKGFYDKFILLLDFNSLYPSIIQEYNICFTTVAHSAAKQNSEEDDGDYDESLIPEEGLTPGVLPTEIRKLVQSRRQVRQMMKVPDISHDQYLQYDIRQKALKLTANSMYGCLGFGHSRFYAKRLAALVTGKGREILLKTKDLVQSMNFDVIYGDTDSIMVNTGCTDVEQVYKIGNRVKQEVNKLYRQLEIDIDGVFQSMLLLKKKKYAALSIQKVNSQYVATRELKGLDIVRRDWCSLAKEAGNYVVDQILSGNSRELIVENIHAKLIEIGQMVEEGQFKMEFFIITKQLTKNPEDYPDKNSLPHVQVALRLNTKAGRKWRNGDTVAYIICLDGSNLPASQRGYHPEELSKRSDLQIDAKYYLAHQLHPVVSRLCDPIDGTDAAHIAKCLGLDPSAYHHSASYGADEDDALLGASRISDEERYHDCERFCIQCQKCKNENTISQVLISKDQNLMEFVLLKCSTDGCNSVLLEQVASIKNKILIAIRSHIRRYYEGWMKCEDVTCGARTRMLPLDFSNEHPLCHACSKGHLLLEYTEHKLYIQLSFYQHLFDVERALLSVPVSQRETTRCQLSQENIKKYRDLKCYVDKFINRSAYAYVNLGQLFKGLFKLK